jgi:hypothetical protein
MFPDRDHDHSQPPPAVPAADVGLRLTYTERDGQPTEPTTRGFRDELGLLFFIKQERRQHSSFVEQPSKMQAESVGAGSGRRKDQIQLCVGTVLDLLSCIPDLRSLELGMGW